jgi:hypothetical protein
MTTAVQKIVIIGATSAIAEHCARLWLAQGANELLLVGRNADRLERVRADLTVRQPACKIGLVIASLTELSGIKALVDTCCEDATPDVVLVAHGSLPDQTTCQHSLDETRQALEVNALSPALVAEAFAARLDAAGHGKLIMIGSVAGDRGRKINYVYGAAKGLVERYAQGLQHRLAGTNVTVTLVKPGPTDTPMTAHLKGQGAKLAPVEDVAARIVDGATKGKAVVYAPAKWELIMLIIRHLPRFIFNKLNI